MTTFKVVASRRRISRLGDTLRVVHDTPYIVDDGLDRAAAYRLARRAAERDHGLDVIVEEES